ncbi:acetyltransferase [Flavobacterium capsici]|uniref:Acetyltransferase n=1 Tax=Flavobacterium capsici TaxID=3075618 RepID=A0AA96J4B6_9FLAO|nr:MULTISPECIES: acetyltransferase [unclassified Flavobacterium]WNM20237.1 acetyltransferase [Flavobacterium sp. PMR2A8]WNM21627.1 acetyltransferase [Flavobacterium sp. PMTSA4]
MENNITLYGASGHGKVIVDLVMACDFNIKAIIDDSPKVELLLGHLVTKTKDAKEDSLGNTIISIGNNKVRKRLSQMLKTDFATAIHPSATVSPFATIEEGTVVMAGAVINPEANIGKHCIINTNATIEHDANIEDFVHICPGVALAGNVSVGEGTQVGIGTSVIQGIKIGKWVTIGAGAVIINDIPDYAVVVGNPGKIIKYKQEND